MNIVEKEAYKFGDGFIRGVVASIPSFQNKLIPKIAQFKNDRDKIFFLRVLLEEVKNQKKDHKKICNLSHCATDDLYEYGLFAIAQELEEIESYYTEEENNKDSFTFDERVTIHNQINTIIIQIEETGSVEELQKVKEELEELKDNFSIGKKKWVQLCIGKIQQLTTDGLIDRTVVELIYRGLSYGFVELGSYIGKLLISF